MEAGNEIIENKPASPRRSSLVRAALRLLLGFILLVLLSMLIDTEEILRAYERADGLLIGLAALLLSFNLGFQIIKWRILLRLLQPSVTLYEATASFLFGLTLGTLTPGQVGEFGGRALRHETDKPGRVVGLTILDKLQVFGVMAIGGLWSLALLFSVMNPLNIIILLILTLLIAFLLIRPGILYDVLTAIGVGKIRHRWMSQILESLSLVREVRVILVTLFLTILFYLTVYAQTYVLLNAFSAVSPLDAFLGYSSMMFAKSLLPITVGDLGTREAGMVYFLSLRSIPSASSFNASLLLFVVNLLFPAISGLFFIPRSFSFRKSP